MKSTGTYGEDLACSYLDQKGYLVLERNYRYGKAEIDIIARKNDLLLFIEVKTRTNINYGYPESFLSDSQAQRIIEAAEEYIFRNDWKGQIRFDIISIIIGDSEELKHFKDAFY